MGYVFPDSPAPRVPGLVVSDEYNSLIAGPYPSGRTVVGKAREYPLYRATLAYERQLIASMADLFTLFRNVRGMYGTFTFFDFGNWNGSPVGLPWIKLYVGVGDGVTVTFDLPMKTATTRTVYVNSVATAVTFNSGAGTDGRDSVTFAGAPTSGHIIELTATGRRAVYARFETDRLSWDEYISGQVSMSVDIVEAR